MTRTVVIAGGGTSGHVLPAIAIAESLVDAGLDLGEISYMGAKRGIETQLIPATGLQHEFFDVDGLQRSFSLTAWRKNVLFLPKLLKARRLALKRFRQNRPSVVVSVGGYASLPGVLAARTLKIPIVVVSYDRVPGKSSAITARFATHTAVAFPDSSLPRAVFTGAPVRRSIRRIDRGRDRRVARETLEIVAGKFVIGVIGGSLGSLILNNAVRKFVKEFRDDAGLVVLHVVGDRFVNDFDRPLSDDPVAIDYRVSGYREDMASMYAAVDVLIARGGAGTVADIATAGVPAILVPWSGAASDHQTANVRWLSGVGAAIEMSESNIESDLSRVLTELRDDTERREMMASKAWQMGETNRQGQLAHVIIETARGL